MILQAVEVIDELSEVLNPEDFLPPPPPPPSATVPEYEADTEDNGDWTDTSDEEEHHDGVQADVEKELREWLQKMLSYTTGA